MAAVHTLANKKSDNRKHNTERGFSAVPNSSSPTRWICKHNVESSDIEAYSFTTGSLQIIASTRKAKNIDARQNAEYIIQAVNNYDKNLALISELICALDMCLANERLTWEAEQEAEIVVARAKRISR